MYVHDQEISLGKGNVVKRKESAASTHYDQRIELGRDDQLGKLLSQPGMLPGDGY